jgi:hypothetical protein
VRAGLGRVQLGRIERRLLVPAHRLGAGSRHFQLVYA